MPFRIVLHNEGAKEDYLRVEHSNEVTPAIVKMIKDKEDWRDCDTIIVFKVTDVDAKNEDFWDNLMSELRNR